MHAIGHETEYRGLGTIEAIKSRRVVICGLGALGSNLADGLARQGFHNLYLIDFDRVGAENLGTQCYSRRHIGRLKADVMKLRIHEELGIEVDANTSRLTSSNLKLLKDADVIVDCFDNHESRKLLFDYGNDTGTDVLHVGLNADYGEVVWNDAPYRVPQPVETGDDCDYPLARNIAILAATVAAECLIEWPDRKNSFRLTLRDRKITRWS